MSNGLMSNGFESNIYEVNPQFTYMCKASARYDMCTDSKSSMSLTCASITNQKLNNNLFRKAVTNFVSCSLAANNIL